MVAFSQGLTTGSGLRQQRRDRQSGLAEQREKIRSDYLEGADKVAQVIAQGSKQGKVPVESGRALIQMVLMAGADIIKRGNSNLTEQDILLIGEKFKIASSVQSIEQENVVAAEQAGAVETAEQTAAAQVQQQFVEPTKPEMRTIGNQIIQISQGPSGVDTEVIFTGQETDPKPETFFNPQKEIFFTVDTSNRGEVEEAQKIGAFKATPKTGAEDKEPTSGQRLAAGFGLRLEQSGSVIDEIGDQFTGAVSRGVGIVPQGLRTEDRQRFDQASRNFINATLRRESGAAIQQSEFDSANIQYIPQPGDGDELLNQKKQNRNTITQALKLEAGSAFDQLKASVPQTVVVSIKGKDVTMNVGQIITNSNGQKGRVEQDGSITVLK